MGRRLIDVLVNTSGIYKTTGNDMFSRIGSSMPIVIDNVARYYWEVEDNVLLHTDYPNIAPPFDDMFFEWRTPKTIKFHGKISEWPGPPEFYGVRIVSFRTPEKDRIGDFETAEWCLFISALSYNEKDKEVSTPDYAVSIFVDGKGRAIRRVRMSPVNKRGVNNLRDVVESAGPSLSSDFINRVSPALMAISFMHCKNVEIVKSPSLPLTRKRRDNPRIRYYTLKIEPMRKVLRSDGESDSKGIKHALHICRGHFKDYRDTGLFGKNKGLYWWESHVRGSASQGVVVKDYKVNTPNPDQSNS